MDGTEQPRQVLVKCVLVGDNAVRGQKLQHGDGDGNGDGNSDDHDNAENREVDEDGQPSNHYDCYDSFVQVGKTRLICARACNQKVYSINNYLNF